MTTPANDSYARALPETQYQDGNDSQAHIAKNVAPLFGQVKNVAKDSNPSITMKHLTTLMKINVNAGTDAITVKNITLSTSTEKICGSYYINIAGTSPTFTESTYGAKTAVKLNVSNGTEIAAETTASFYIAIKPFVAPANEKMTMVITTTDGKVCTKEASLPVGTTFEAGEINNLNVTFVEDPFVGSTFVPATSIAVGDEIIITGKKDGDVYVLSTTQNNNNRASIVATVTDGTIVSTKAMASLTVGAGEANSAYFTFYDATNNGYLYAASGGNNYLRTQSSVDENAKWNVTFAGTTATVIATGSSNRNKMRFNKDNNPPIFSCYATTATTGVDLAIYKRDSRTALATPANLQVNSATKVVTWDAVTGAGSYDVTVGTTTTNVTTTSYTFDGDDYYYDVTVVAVPSDAVNYRNSAAATLEHQLFGNKPKINAPTLVAGSTTSASVTVTWTDDAAATSGYACTIATKAASTTPIGEPQNIAKGVQKVTFTGLDAETAYIVSVNANAVTPDYDASDVKTIEISTIAAGTPPIVLTLDWSSGNITSTPSFPTSKVVVPTTYVIDSYSWVFAGDGFYYYSTGTALLIGKLGSYIQTPAIGNYKLTKVELKCNNHNNAGISSKFAIYNTASSPSITAGGDEQAINKRDGTIFSYDLTETAVNTSYRIQNTSSSNAQFDSITVTYSYSN